MKLVAISICFFYLLFNNSDAAILFMDVNNNGKEIETAQRAAEKRGEKLIIIPSFEQMSVNTRKKLRRVTDDIEYLSNQRVRCSNNCLEIQKKIEILAKQRDEIQGDFKIDLERDLKAVNETGEPLSSFIISGHHGSAKYSGTLGGFSVEDFINTLGKVSPSSLETVRSAHLWGCYTTLPGYIDGIWKKSFPNLGVVSGFKDLGPSQKRQGNHDYLEGILTREPSLIAAADDQNVQDIISSIPSITSMSSALYVSNRCGQEFYADIQNHNEVRVQNFADSKSCSEDKFTELLGKFLCYDKAVEPECSEPPNESGNVLRQFHSLFQDVSHQEECKAFVMNELHGLDRTVSENDVLTLIKYKYMKNNSLDIFNKQFKDSIAMLKEMGITFPSIDSLKKMKRGEVRKAIEQLKLDIDKNLDGDNRKLAEKFSYSFDQLLLNHQSYCFSGAEGGLSSYIESTPENVVHWPNPQCEIDNSIGITAKKSVELDKAKYEILQLNTELEKAENLIKINKLQNEIEEQKRTEYSQSLKNELIKTAQKDISEKILEVNKLKIENLENYSLFLESDNKNKDVLKHLQSNFTKESQEMLKSFEEAVAGISSDMPEETKEVTRNNLSERVKAFQGIDPYRNNEIGKLKMRLEYIKNIQSNTTEEEGGTIPDHVKANEESMIIDLKMKIITLENI